MQLNKAIEVETMQYEKTGDLESYGGHLKTSVKPYMACRRERGQVRREKWKYHDSQWTILKEFLTRIIFPLPETDWIFIAAVKLKKF